MKYHINPKSGEPGVCKAEKQCPFTSLENHFSNAEDARVHFEEIMKGPKSLTKDESENLSRVRLNQISTIDAIADAEIDIILGGVKVESVWKLKEWKYSMDNSEEISKLAVYVTEGESEFEDGLDEVTAISYNPLGSLVEEHHANLFTDNGTEYILDLAYSEIDPNADFPYVNTCKNWKKNLDRISFMGSPEYVKPPVDPRTLNLPKFEKGEDNPLIERSALSTPLALRNGTFVRFLVIDDVKVAGVKYFIKDGEPHLWSLETRHEYKNQGYMSKLLKDLAKEYNVEKVTSSNSFTNQGYNFTRHLTKPSSEAEAAVNFPEYTEEKPFSFIADWVEGVPYS